MARNAPGAAFESPIALTGLVNRETLGAGKTLVVGDANIQRIDPAAHRIVVLPAEASSNGLWFLIINAANAGENITVNNDAGGAIGVPGQNDAGLFHCDGTTWYLDAVFTIGIT